MRKGREIIHVPRVSNFRGLGGIKVGEKHFRYGLAFRCAALHKIKPNGVKSLQKLNIRYDFDLRTELEKKQKPDLPIEGIELREIDILSSALPGVSHEELEGMDPIEFIRRSNPMDELYVHMMTSCLPRLKKAYLEMVTCLENNEPFLFHCTQGKDRTGLLAFLLLGTLGADMEDIMEDYLLTKRYGSKTQRVQALLVGLKDKEAMKKARAMSVPKREYLEAAYKVVMEEGGFEPFAIKKLGMSEERIQSLRNICLE